MITVYRVEKGDTFASIGAKFGVSPEGIKFDNNFSCALFEGARLIIRPTKSIYTVKPFEKLSEIAVKLNVSLTKLMEANKLDKPFVFAGQVLIIPDDEK